MKKTFTLLLFACCILFSSCFEIVEQVFVKNNGSGNFQLVLNCSKSKTKINSIMKMKTINGHDVPTQQVIKNKLAELEKTTASTVGISNVKSNIDFDNYIITMSCDFANVTQLNNVVKNISATDKGNKKFVEKSYAFTPATKIFERLNKISLLQDYNKMSNADKEVFATANYTSIYKFESEIVSSTNADAKISPSKKAIMLKQNALDIITQKKSIENKITITK